MRLQLLILKPVQIRFDIGGDRLHILLDVLQPRVQILLPRVTQQAQHLLRAVLADISDRSHAEYGGNDHGDDDRADRRKRYFCPDRMHE